MTQSNMAPGSESDHRSGIHADDILCPSCKGYDDQCIYCEDGMVSEREYRADKELEKEDQQANE